MNQRIAVEPGLTPFKDLLRDRGYQVESIKVGADSSMADNYDAYIVTGMNSNLLGMGNTSSNAVVINASGLTPEQVVNELQSRLS